MWKVKWDKYAWAVIIGGFFIMSLLHSMTKTCFSLYMVPVTRELGVSRMSYSLCAGIINVAIAILSPWIGRVLSRYETMKWAFLISVVGMSLSYCSYSLATSIYQMYISSVLVGIFNTGAVIIPISICLVKCCDNHIGLAIGIALAGSGIGGSIATPLLTKTILLHGWQTAFFRSGLIMLLVCVPMALLMCWAVREKESAPSDSQSASQPRSSSPGQNGTSLSHLKRQSFFYIYLLGMFTGLFVSSGGHAHLSAYMTEAYSPAFSNAIVSFFLMLLTPFKIILSWLYDRIGILLTNLVMLLSFSVAYLMLEVNTGEGMMWVMAIFFTIGVSSGSIAPSIVTADLFGTKDYGEIFGYIYRFCMLGSVLASPVLAWIYDTTGSYHLAWMTCFLLCLLTAICLGYAQVSFNQMMREHKLSQTLSQLSSDRESDSDK